MLVVAGQIVTAVVADHFAIMNLPATTSSKTSRKP
ncbi:hypothetical protein ACQKIS_20315 [Pseudomonas fulva]